MNSELYKKTKEGVDHKLLQRKNNRKRVITVVIIFSLFIGVNVTAYASSEVYRSWLARQLGLKTNTTISVKKNVTSGKINMEVLSYYRETNTVVMSMKFRRTDEEKFSEELNIEFLKINKSENSSGEILSSYSYLSEDRKNILVMLTMNVDTDKIIIEAENLLSMTTGECLYSGNWQLEIDVPKQTGGIKKITDETNSVFIQVQNKEYQIKEIYQTANALFFKCDVKFKETAEDRYLSVYGGNITLEYKDGTTNEDYYCVPDKEDNLVVLVWDVNQLKNICQIYIEGKKVIK
jgi:hypothetical protein